MTSYLDTARKITTSFMIIWIMILLTFSRLSFRCSLSTMRILDLFVYYFVPLLGWRLFSTCGLSHFLSHFPFSLNYIFFWDKETGTACTIQKQEAKYFWVLFASLFFCIAFLSYLNFLYSIFLAMIFSSNSIKCSLDIFSTLVSENHHICI